jgi:CRISPR-associated protein Cas6
LFRQVSAVLPWFEDEAAARLHQIHTAATGSGWVRPDSESGDELHLSRRTRLLVRVPAHRAEDSLALSDRGLDVDGYPISTGAGKVVPLTPARTLLARQVVCGRSETETRLIERLTRAIAESGVRGASMICGRSHRIVTPESTISTRSVVVTNLDAEGSWSLLRSGLGPAGKLGCGIFVPYKRIE